MKVTDEHARSSMPAEQRPTKGDAALVPEPTLHRLPIYLTYLKLAQEQGLKYVSSTRMAHEMGVDPTQVTKDLGHTPIVGKTRVGYEVESLIDVLETFLRFNSLEEGYLFGAGSLGRALLLDHGLAQFGFRLRAAFDVDPDKVGLNIGGIDIYHFDDFPRIRRPEVQIGVLTVPVGEAQRVADIVVGSGLKALWNFTSVRLRVPEGVVVQNTSLYAHLAVIFNRLHSCRG